MLHALRDSGWHNYSLFLRGDGLLVGYVESPDLAGGAGGHGGHRRATGAGRPRWRTTSSAWTVAARTRDFQLLTEIFNLDDQLDQIDDATTRDGAVTCPT